MATPTMILMYFCGTYLLRLRAQVHADEPAEAEQEAQGPVRHCRDAVGGGNDREEESARRPR